MLHYILPFDSTLTQSYSSEIDECLGDDVIEDITDTISTVYDFLAILVAVGLKLASTVPAKGIPKGVTMHCKSLSFSTPGKF